MDTKVSWLDKRRESVTQSVKHWGHNLEQKMMRAQWHSAAVDLFSFALEPLWSKDTVPARIESVQRQQGATHVWLRPAQRWAWPKAGQFVSLSVQQENGNLSRCYSLSAIDAVNDQVRLTICDVDGGEFSTQVAPKFRAGEIVQISAADGDFVLSSEPVNAEERPPVWLCAAGSGITPMLPLAEEALKAGQSVRLLYVQRGAAPLLLQEWLSLQALYPSLLRCELWDTETRLRPTQSDIAQRLENEGVNAEVFVCGNEGFREIVQQAFQQLKMPLSQLHMESFYQQNSAPQYQSDAEIVAEVSLGDGRQIPVREGQTILQAAKCAGVSMTHCCGQGVCRSCETRKLTGVVENLHTGLKQLRDGEWILPCISLPVGNVELAV